MNDDIDLASHNDDIGAEANEREVQWLDVEPDDEAVIGALLAECNYLVTDLCQPDRVAVLADASRDDLARTCATIDDMVNLLATARDDCAQQLAHLMEDDTEAIAGLSVTRTRSTKTEWDKEHVYKAVRGVVIDRWITSRTTDPDRMREQFELIDRTFADMATAFSFTPLVTGLKALTINPNEFRATTRSERWSVKVKAQQQ